MESKTQSLNLIKARNDATVYHVIRAGPLEQVQSFRPNLLTRYKTAGLPKRHDFAAISKPIIKQRPPRAQYRYHIVIQQQSLV